MDAIRVQPPALATVRQRGLLRLRRWRDGKYAISATAARDGLTLVEGDGCDFAHLLHLDGDRFVEVTRAVMPVNGGRGTSLALLRSSEPGELQLRRVREFPNGTRRVDIAERSNGAVRRSAHWSFPNGRSADAVWNDGKMAVEFRNSVGELRRRWETTYTPFGGSVRVHTEVYDEQGQRVGFSEATSFSGGQSRTFDVGGRSGTTQKWEKHGRGGTEKGTVKVEGTTVESHYESVSITGGKSSSDMFWDSATGEFVWAGSTTNAAGPDGVFIDGTEMKTVDADGHTSESGTITFDWPESGEGSSTWHWESEDGQVTSISFEETDDAGNTSTSTRTQNSDGSVTITIVSEDSEGNWSSESFTVMPDGSVVDEVVIEHEESDDEEPLEEPTGEEEPTDETGDEGDDDGSDDEDEDNGGDDGDDGDDDGEDEEETEEETPDGDNAEGAFPGDDGGDEGPPVPLGVGWAHAVAALGGGGPAKPPEGSGDVGFGDIEGAAEAAPDIAALLRSHAGGGGTGAPGGGGDTGWGDSESGEEPDPPDLDGAVPGHVVPSADDTGWGDLNHPNALIASAARLVGRKKLATARSTLATAQQLELEM
jgi:hypothetical protein